MIHTDITVISPSFFYRLRYRLVPLICLTIIFTQLLQTRSSAAEAKYILVLHSYHQGLVWTDKIMEGIYSVFNKYDPQYDVHVEYMDTKRYYDGIKGVYLTKLRDTYAEKYSVLKPDIIIASDDYAFQFLLMYGEQLFPGTPIVFCGVNDFEDEMLAGHENITGVTEFLDIKANIDTILNMHPHTDRLSIITDTTVPGISNRLVLEELSDKYKDRVRFVFLDKDSRGLTLQELLDQLRGLPENSMVYYSDFLRNRDEYIVQETAVPQISAAANRPIYTHYDEILGLGVVGGKLINGYSHGMKAAQMAADILQGTPVSSMPVYKKSINTPMFDYIQLKRFNIKESALPEGSVVINKPLSLYREHKQLYWAVLAVFSFLLISLITISANVIKRKKAEEKLRAAYDELEQKVEERTQSLNKANLDLHAEVEERRQAEKALENARMTAEEEKSKMDAIIASIGEGISIQDTSFRVLYQNQLHIDMVG
ncbi:MAG: ABC transporter substrate binding protein, partial [Nitrospirota bacterium]